MGGETNEVLPQRKGGGSEFFVLRAGGGGAKSFGPANFPFCSPPPRN